MKLPNLKPYAVADLIILRDNINVIISKNIGRERAALERQLAAINGYVTPKNGVKKRRPHKLKGIKVAPKYRNPEDRSETWAGRGATPRWMKAAIKGGAKKDDFLIKKGA